MTPGVSHTVAAQKTYGKGHAAVNALNGVTVDFDRGMFSAIMGPSGSGKSTLLHCLAGLDSLTSGQAFIGDREITKMKDKELTKLRRESVGFVFQTFNLVPTLTAKENILLPLTLASKKPDNGWFENIVGKMGLNDRLTHHPSELSGGQQQRVAVARALVSRPEVIFADEPTGNLDSHASHEVMQFMRSAVDDFGQTIVMVTHDPFVASYADRVVFLGDGKVVDELTSPTAESIVERVTKLAEQEAQ